MLRYRREIMSTVLCVVFCVEARSIWADDFKSIRTVIVPAGSTRLIETDVTQNWKHLSLLGLFASTKKNVCPVNNRLRGHGEHLFLLDWIIFHLFRPTAAIFWNRGRRIWNFFEFASRRQQQKMNSVKQPRKTWKTLVKKRLPILQVRCFSAMTFHLMLHRLLKLKHESHGFKNP